MKVTHFIKLFFYWHIKVYFLGFLSLHLNDLICFNFILNAHNYFVNQCLHFYMDGADFMTCPGHVVQYHKYAAHVLNNA